MTQQRKRQLRIDSTDADTQRQYLLQPGRWPEWPFLPMKKYDGPSGFGRGLVFFCEETGTYHFAAPVSILACVTLQGHDFHTMKPDQILKDGWVIA